MTTRSVLLLALLMVGEASVVAAQELASSLPIPAGGEGAEEHSGSRPLTTRDIWVELATYPTAGRGALTRLIFLVANYEDSPARVRLALEVPDGWGIQDSQWLDGEHVLDSTEELEGELHVVVPVDAEPGSRHGLRLVGFIDGDPGVAEATVVVRVVPGGGLRPGQAGLSGLVQGYQQGIDPAARGYGATAGSVHLAGPLSRTVTASLAIERGRRLDQPPVLTSYTDAPDRFAGQLRGRGWSLSGGNLLSVPGGTLAGPFLRTRGAAFRSTGTVAVELAAGEPVSFSGQPGGGHVRGRLVVGPPALRLAVVASAIEADATAYAVPHRLLSGGAEVEAKPGRHHRILLRGGWLDGTSKSEWVTSGAALEGEYALTTSALTVRLRGREMPPSLPGLYLQGDERSADASMALFQGLRIAARGYTIETRAVDRGVLWDSRGASTGLQLSTSGGYRGEVRLGQRESRAAAAASVHRTVTATAMAPAGGTSINVMAEYGMREEAAGVTPTMLARAGVRWDGAAGSANGGVTTYDYGVGEATVRADMSASLRTALVDLDGGAWFTHGPSYGGSPGAWLNLVAPVGWGVSVIAGAELVQGRLPYVRYLDPLTGEPLPPEVAADPTRAPYVGVPVHVPAGAFRASLGVRKRLVIPFSATSTEPSNDV